MTITEGLRRRADARGLHQPPQGDEDREPEDRPRRHRPDTDRLGELGVSAVAAAVGVWTPFHLAGWDAPFGFVVCWFAALVAIYGVTVHQRHGALELRDRLATLTIGAGTTVALLPL